MFNKFPTSEAGAWYGEYTTTSVSQRGNILISCFPRSFFPSWACDTFYGAVEKANMLILTLFSNHNMDCGFFECSKWGVLSFPSQELRKLRLCWFLLELSKVLIQARRNFKAFLVHPLRGFLVLHTETIMTWVIWTNTIGALLLLLLPFERPGRTIILRVRNQNMDIVILSKMEAQNVFVTQLWGAPEWGKSENERMGKAKSMEIVNLSLFGSLNIQWQKECFSFHHLLLRFHLIESEWRWSGRRGWMIFRAVVDSKRLKYCERLISRRLTAWIVSTPTPAARETIRQSISVTRSLLRRRNDNPYSPPSLRRQHRSWQMKRKSNNLFKY